MTEEEILKSTMDVCDIHVARIKEGMEHLLPLYPLKPKRVRHLSFSEITAVEFLMHRFAALQDLIGRKIFPLILELLKEDEERQTFIDKLNKLEKLGILEEVEFWSDLRRIRNFVTHDYPDDPVIATSRINICFSSCEDLLEFWEGLKVYIAEQIYKQQRQA